MGISIIPRNAEKTRTYDMKGQIAGLKDGYTILDKDEILNAIRKITKYNQSKTSSNKLTKEQREQEKIKAEEFYEKVDKKFTETNAEFQPYLFSAGGTNSFSDKDARGTMATNGIKTAYTAIIINGIVILEPMGQPGNATYISRDSEDLYNNLKTMGRDEAIKEGVIYKVTHDQAEEKEKVGRYNYESGHILQLMDYAHESPDMLMDSLKEVKDNNKEFSSLKTIVSSISDKKIKESNDVAKVKEVKELIEKVRQSMGALGLTNLDSIVKESVLSILQKEEKYSNISEEDISKAFNEMEDR